MEKVQRVIQLGSGFGVIHKPRGQLRGEGVSQMTILLHKPYLVKVTKKGGPKIPKKLTIWFMNDLIIKSDLFQLTLSYIGIEGDFKKDFNKVNLKAFFVTLLKKL